MTDDPIRDRIRQILLADWDPANAGRFDAAHGEYDGYISPIADLIRSGADEGAIIAFLKSREEESMCFPALGTRHLNRVAAKLIALRC